MNIKGPNLQRSARRQVHYWQFWVGNFQEFAKDFMKLCSFIKFSVLNRSMKRYIVSFKGINSCSCNVNKRFINGVSITVNLTKLWTPEIFLECYCVARNKSINRKITKLQTATVISLWFWGCLHILNFIVISQYTINISEIFQVFTVFWVS